MRRVLLLVGSIVFVDTLFFAALTPLLPHYADELGLGKAGAGVLAAAYPAGAFFGAIPSGIVAARFGVKPTVLVGMSCVAVTTALFGFATEAWQLDLARFLQGLASAFSWTGALAWLVAAAPSAQARRADRAGVRGRRRRRALRPGARRDRVGRGHRLDVRRRRDRARSASRCGRRRRRPRAPESRSRSRRSCAAVRDRRILLAIWLVVLPALLFGTLGVLGPLRLAELGFGAIAIGAIWLTAGVLETGNNVVIGRLSDRRGPLVPVRVGLIATVDRDADPPLARRTRTCSPS